MAGLAVEPISATYSEMCASILATLALKVYMTRDPSRLNLQAKDVHKIEDLLHLLMN